MPSTGVTQQIVNLRAGILQLTAALADGTDPLTNVAFTIYTAARDIEGNRKRITESHHQEAGACFLLPAGPCYVTAAYGNASANDDVEITPAGVTDRVLNLRAGILRLTAVIAGSGEPGPGGVA